MSIKIAICQVRFRTGDITGNLKKISNLSSHYSKKGINLIVFPELALTGYLARDLFFKKSFLDDVQNSIESLIKLSKELDLTIILPCPYVADNHKYSALNYNPNCNQNGVLYNSAIAIYQGKIVGISSKKHLPNFDLFDEQRYFTPGRPEVINIQAEGKVIKIGFPICRDVWHEDVCSELKDQGAELLISLNASPFAKGKHDQRIDVVKSRYLETRLPIIYCNQILGHDGIVFDGKSFAYDGKFLQIAPAFKECISVAEVKEKNISLISEDLFDEMIYELNSNATSQKPYLIKYSCKNYVLSKSEENLADIYNAMVIGCRDYVLDNGFGRAILGISGGIDSAIVATICVDAFGSENVTGVMMPTKFSSKQSRNDAIKLADNLGIELLEIPITDPCESIALSLGAEFDWLSADIMMQNLQSRIRGVVLMAITNNSIETQKMVNIRVVRSARNPKARSSMSVLLITTGNKSEYATGYATIYGDMNGAFNPIKDIYKSELFELSKFRNKIAAFSLDNQDQGEVIPKSIINKPPTAELTAGQKDSDSLPDYKILDDILEMYIEGNLSILEISNKYPSDLVKKIVKSVNISEFKRQQSAPGVRISCKSFNIDRRYPITNTYL